MIQLNARVVSGRRVLGIGADATLDMVIANNVLEHVDDDPRAVREIKRVLRPGGRAVLQTPCCASLHETWSDSGIVTDAAPCVKTHPREPVRRVGGASGVARLLGGGA